MGEASNFRSGDKYASDPIWYYERRLKLCKMHKNGTTYILLHICLIISFNKKKLYGKVRLDFLEQPEVSHQKKEKKTF